MVQSMLDAALWWAKRGIPVFPCNPSTEKKITKSPMLPAKKGPGGKQTGGLYLATTGPEQIKRWWQRWPQALIGVPTGKASNVCVIDLDPRSHSGTSMLQALLDFCDLKDFDGPLIRTQSGGYHLWFAYEDGLGNRANLFKHEMFEGVVEAQIREHVDVRADGGYVIVPPSRMENGNKYIFEPELKGEAWPTPPPLPPQLADAIAKRGDFSGEKKKKAEAKTAATRTEAEIEDQQVRRYALVALDMEIQELRRVREGGRGSALNTAAYNLGQLVGSGVLSHSVCAAALKVACDDNGLSMTDGGSKVDANIDRALNDGAKKPRDLDEIRRQSRRRALRGGGPSPHGSPRPPKGSDAASLPSGGGKSGDRTGGPSKSAGEPMGGRKGDWDDLALCVDEPETDIGNARRLLHRYGKDIVSIARIGMHYFDGKRWEEDIEGRRVRPLLHETAEAINREPLLIKATFEEQMRIDAFDAAVEEHDQIKTKKKPEASDIARMRVLEEIMENAAGALKAVADRRGSRRRHAKGTAKTGRLDAMMNEASPYIKQSIEDFDQDALAINCNNCTLFVRRKDPKSPYVIDAAPHSREHMITKILPVDYKQDAECPNFLRFLEEVLPDELIDGSEGPGEAVRTFIQRFFGYSFTGLTTEQVFIFLYGEGLNGKSTLVDIICAIAGEYATTVPFETLAGEDKRKGADATPDLARLPGARLVRSSEPEASVALKEATVKALTGGEPILVRRLHEDFIEVYPIFKLVLSGNHKPKIRGQDYGIWRRVCLVPFLVQIPENQIDKDLKDKLWEERSGIFNWILAGLLSFLEEGLNIPEAVQAATEEYREESDPIGEFIRDMCDITDDTEDEERPGDLYDAFTRYAERTGVISMNKPTFCRQLPSYADKFGFRKHKRSGTLYQMIKLKPEAKEQAAAAGPNRDPDDPGVIPD